MAGTQPLTEGIIFFAHGSRDPAWAAPFEAVAARARQLAPQTCVQLAYLELMVPALPEAVESCAAAGVRRLRIVPLFLGRGRHVGEDLAKLVEAARTLHPDMTFELAPAIGEAPEVVQAMAHVAISGWTPRQ